MSALSFDTRCKSFAKAQHRFDDCLIRQIVPDGLHSLVGSAILWFWFPLTKTYYDYL